MNSKIQNIIVRELNQELLKDKSLLNKFVAEQISGVAKGIPLPKNSELNQGENHLLKTDATVRKSYIEVGEQNVNELKKDLVRAERSQDQELEDLLNQKTLALKTMKGNIYKLEKLRKAVRQIKAAIQAREVIMGRTLKDEKLHYGYIFSLYCFEATLTCSRIFFSEHETGLVESGLVGFGVPLVNLGLIAVATWAWFEKWSTSLRLAVITTGITSFLGLNGFIAVEFVDQTNTISMIGSIAYFFGVCILMWLFHLDLKRVFSLNKEDLELLNKLENSKNTFGKKKIEIEASCSALMSALVKKFNGFLDNFQIAKESFKSKAAELQHKIAELVVNISKLTDAIEELGNDNRATVRDAVCAQNDEISIPDYYYEPFKLIVTDVQFDQAGVEEKIQAFDKKIVIFDKRISEEKKSLTKTVELFITELQAISNDRNVKEIQND